MSNKVIRDRRTVIAIAVMSLFVCSAFADDNTGRERFTYRGFAVDISAVDNAQNLSAIISSIKHQIDIVADCGASPDIINFFRNRRIKLGFIPGDEPGRYETRIGVVIDATPQPFDKPILLHELLHVFHRKELPDGERNADVLHFYRNAQQEPRYRPRKRGDRYMFKNPKEFFAVTASAYLWGTADRQPYTRENLKFAQPNYYVWLGRVFGVQK